MALAVMLVLAPLAAAIAAIMVWGACKQLVIVGWFVVRLLIQDTR